MALSLESTVRNAGKHAGGVVISPTKLTDFAPLYCDEEGNNLVTQFDKDDVEAVGLVKFDFLGLRTLTIIDWALQDINARLRSVGKAPVDITLIPRDDPASYALLKNGDTTAVFQLESRGMKELIKKLRPDCFDDIIALVALFRPGPLESGMVDDYVNVKHKRQKAEYAHLLLEPILKPTNGVILYQEQVMQIAREMALYTLGGADMLRRAMGKKKPEEMAKERDKFIKGATENHVDEKVSSYVFDLMEKFAGYGFNKSHSAAYALVAYQTAWLKAHYPAEFMAAVLSADMDNTDKVVILIEECRDMKLKILPPSINVSRYKFTVNGAGQIVYGLGALKGAGEAAIEEMVKERDENGLFSGLYDLCKRMDLRKFNKRVLEALIRAGAFDEFDDNRAAHWAELPTALRIAEQHGKMAAAGQNDLFGLAVSEESAVDDSQTYTTEVAPWTLKERLEAEKTVLGLYLTGHPIEQYDAELKKFIPKTIAALLTDLERSRNGNKVKVAGLAIDIGIRQNKQGKSRGTAILDDNTGRLEISAFREAFDTYQAVFTKYNKDTVLVAEGLLAMDEYLNVPRLTVEKLFNYDHARELYARNLTLTWAAEQSATNRIETLKTVLTPFKGGSCPLQIAYSSNTARATLALGDAWRVQITDELLAGLSELFAEVELNYK
jgi:DNA polymerase-3 subunit alpha